MPNESFSGSQGSTLPLITPSKWYAYERSRCLSGKRTIPELEAEITRCLDRYTVQECRNYFQRAGYQLRF